ncbi:MAG: glycosyltransferase [Chloroflexi bacterium]|nr:glycosyltransferase [Chloroflexota bacterium]
MSNRIAYLGPLPADFPATGMKIRMDRLIAALRSHDGVDLHLWHMPAEHDISVRTNGKSAVTTVANLVVAGMTLASPYLPRAIPASAESEIFAWLSTVRPELVVLYHDTFTGLIPRLVSQGYSVVVDGDNVRSPLAWQAIRWTTSLPEFAQGVSRWAVTRQRERRLFPLVQEVWACSTKDAQQYRDIIGGDVPVAVVPNVVDMNLYPPDSNPEPNSMGFFGEFTFPPNEMAAVRLIREVLPRVRQTIPDAQLQLYLVGRNPSDRLRGIAAEQPGVIVTGTVDDTLPWLARCSVLLAPIEYGSGTRLKILEALAMAKPMVATAKGSEGLSVRDGEHLLIREVEFFADAITAVLADGALAHGLGQRGRELVTAHYSSNALREIVGTRLNRLLVAVAVEHPFNILYSQGQDTYAAYPITKEGVRRPRTPARGHGPWRHGYALAATAAPAKEGAPAPRHFFVELEGMRCIAAGAVFIYHLWLVLKIGRITLLNLDVTAFPASGGLGVDFFFILSGFLLALPWLRSYEQGAVHRGRPLPGGRGALADRPAALVGRHQLQPLPVASPDHHIPSAVAA